MATTYTKARGVHFVGSAPYASAEETFTKLATALPGRLRRIPDGEPGERNYWTWRLHRCFPDWALSPLSYPAKLAASRGEPDPGPEHWFSHQAAAPARPPGAALEVGPTDYAEAAVASYGAFKRLKERGVIEAGTRFLFPVATSCAVVCTHVARPFRTEADAALEPQVLAALAAIQRAVPADELAIQLDLACEMGMLENEAGRAPDLWFGWFEPGTVTAELVPRVLRYIDAVRHPVELGLHFCYGDIAHRHWAQPLDTARVADFFAHIRRGAGRSIDFVHLPVPVDRHDEEYFRPLAALDIDEKTELYLGLVREEDLEGTERRLAAAQRVVKRPFGVATECGMGRITETRLADDILRISSTVAGPV